MRYYNSRKESADTYTRFKRTVQSPKFTQPTNRNSTSAARNFQPSSSRGHLIRKQFEPMKPPFFPAISPPSSRNRRCFTGLSGTESCKSETDGEQQNSISDTEERCHQKSSAGGEGRQGSRLQCFVLTVRSRYSTVVKKPCTSQHKPPLSKRKKKNKH